jgi:hypothetical protein
MSGIFLQYMPDILRMAGLSPWPIRCYMPEKVRLAGACRTVYGQLSFARKEAWLQHYASPGK